MRKVNANLMSAACFFKSQSIIDALPAKNPVIPVSVWAFFHWVPLPSLREFLGAGLLAVKEPLALFIFPPTSARYFFETNLVKTDQLDSDRQIQSLPQPLPHLSLYPIDARSPVFRVLPLDKFHWGNDGVMHALKYAHQSHHRGVLPCQKVYL